MRDVFEQRERDTLASFAVKSCDSRGQAHSEPLSETRTYFQRDRDRVVHSKSFRRLKHKTQVFIVTISDHYRSRLTHTLEVAQISRHLARLLQLNEDLCEVIALAHDLGHTPFGHSGERALNELMAHHDGFEHNVQSYRIVTELEKKYPSFPGLNLSFEVLQGLLKHTSKNSSSPSATFKSIEAQSVNLADEIAYNNHDIDDGLLSGILVESELTEHVSLYKEAREEALRRYTNLSTKERHHMTNSILISWFINDLVNTTQNHIASLGIHTLDDIQLTTGPIAKFSPELHEKNLELRRFLFTRFYQHPDVYKMNKRGQMIIQQLFATFTSDTKTLPIKQQEQIQNGALMERVVADYIAGMTDTFAEKEFASLYK